MFTLVGAHLAWALTALSALAAEDLRPLKPAVGPNLWLPALLATIAVLAAVGLLARARGRLLKSTGFEPSDAPGALPRQTLRARLERVRDSGWIEGGSHLKACDAIAEVMRDLARARWVLSTPRLTTSELLGELASHGADSAITAPLGDVLEACDLVKFAGARFRPADLRGHLDTAFVLVDVYAAGPWTDLDPVSAGRDRPPAVSAGGDRPPGAPTDQGFDGPRT